MHIVSTLVILLAVTFDSIALGSQSRGLSHSDADPDSSCSGHSSPYTRANSSTRSSTSSGSPLRSRSRSPPSWRHLPISFRVNQLRLTFPRVLGYKFDDLRLIRLTPRGNSNRIFELRKYVLPSDKPIGLKNKRQQLIPLPSGEQLVLSTPESDIWAILEKLPNRNQIWRGLFMEGSKRAIRARVNMDSGEVEEMTKAEIEECPVGNNVSIKTRFRVFLVEP